MASTTQHDHAGDGIELFAALVELGVRVTQAMATVVTDSDVLTNATISTLIRLHLNGPQRPSQLATHLGVSRPQVTKLLDVLEEEQLIHRRRGDTADRRVTMVTLTASGQRVIDAGNQLLATGIDDLSLALDMLPPSWSALRPARPRALSTGPVELHSQLETRHSSTPTARGTITPPKEPDMTTCMKCGGDELRTKPDNAGAYGMNQLPLGKGRPASAAMDSTVCLSCGNVEFAITSNEALKKIADTWDSA